MPRRRFSQSTISEESPAEPGPSQTKPPSPKRGRRNLSQWSASTSCPVCGVTIRLSEAAAHFETEVLRLEEVATLRTVRRAAQASVDKPSNEDSTSEQRRLQWKAVRKNRSSRLTAKTGPVHLRRRFGNGGSSSVSCPVCEAPLDHLADDDERTRHVDECLEAQPGNSSGDLEGGSVQVDIDGSSDAEGNGIAEESGIAGFDEYEWAGQTRVRAHAAFETVIPRSNRTGQEEDIGDLDVDGDEEAIFGQPQFSEADLIPISQDNSTQLIREAMVRTAGANDGTPLNLPSKWDTIEDLTKIDQMDSSLDADDGDRDEENGVEGKSLSARRKEPNSAASKLVIDSLREKIRELETKLSASDGARCLVCLQAFTRPLASIVCWHVYCQDCWLKTLSCKKLCPLCSMITSPGDLRRIYL